ncbi:TPM domain-containing protein [Mucilaginibacter sp.]
MLKKICWLLSLMLVVYSGFAQKLPPKSNTLVTDFTNTLSEDDKQRLEQKLVAFDDSSSIQVAVVMIKSVGEYDINEYGTTLGRAWGIGNTGKNNGVLLLVAVDDRKVTIQTGYGIEGSLPDITTQQIISNDITPHFKQGDYYGGLDAATTNIIKATKGEYKADAGYANRGRKQNGNGGGGGAGFIILIVIIVLFFIFRNRGGGGGGSIIGGRGSASPFWWFLAGNLLGGGGRSSGGGSGWGGDSGGSSGGGGFGGFGGGSFGGGGSSGSW